MRAGNKIRILACLAVMIGAICAMSGCMSRKEQDRRNEELVAAYPEEVKAYLEEKYGREFCVSSEREAGEGSPIPFAESYFTYDYIAWEDEEDGYAFWTSLYPVSLDDNRVTKIRDGYCWKFISRKIKEEFCERWKEITDEDVKVMVSASHKFVFGEKINESSTIKAALISMIPDFTTLYIYIIFPPGLGWDEEAWKNKTEDVANDFYDEHVLISRSHIWVKVYETYTKEDFLKIETERTEQYMSHVKESEYEGQSEFPVKLKPIVEIKANRAESD